MYGCAHGAEAADLLELLNQCNVGLENAVAENNKTIDELQQRIEAYEKALEEIGMGAFPNSPSDCETLLEEAMRFARTELERIKAAPEDSHE